MAAEGAIEIRDGIEPGLVSRLAHPTGRVQQQSFRGFDAGLRAIRGERQSRLFPKQFAEITRTDVEALGEFAHGHRLVGGRGQLRLDFLQQGDRCPASCNNNRRPRELVEVPASGRAPSGRSPSAARRAASTHAPPGTGIAPHHAEEHPRREGGQPAPVTSATSLAWLPRSPTHPPQRV